MIKEIKRTSQFKKDYKKAIKSGCKEEDFREVLKYLVAQKPLPEKYRDHGTFLIFLKTLLLRQQGPKE